MGSWLRMSVLPGDRGDRGVAGPKQVEVVQFLSEAATMSPMTAILKTEIVRGLECLGEGGLDEVRAHVAALVEATGRRRSARKSLAGIWKGRGFERVSDLEGEIRGARKELSDAIARRRL